MQTHVNDYMSLQHQKINVFMKNIRKTGPGHHFFRHVKKMIFRHKKLTSVTFFLTYRGPYLQLSYN